jgi:dTDP-4-dehydrorhamnose reductase
VITMVTGAAGLVGKTTVSHFIAQGERVIDLDHRALDISNHSSVKAVFAKHRPDVVINCAALTDVDGCELDRENARSVNAQGPELLARACQSVGALLVTISTDYVFDGEKKDFYTQRDQPNPQSVYAASKLEGERRAQQAWARTIVVRSGYIFGENGNNFLSSFLARARRGEQLDVINDSFGTPTYAPHLAARLYELSRLDLPGLYHVVNAGEGASFEDFARVAFQIAELDPALLHSVSMKSLNRAAARPRNSRLRCLLSEAVGLDPLPYWKEAVLSFVNETSRVARIVSSQ